MRLTVRAPALAAALFIVLGYAGAASAAPTPSAAPKGKCVGPPLPAKYVGYLGSLKTALASRNCRSFNMLIQGAGDGSCEFVSAVKLSRFEVGGVYKGTVERNAYTLRYMVRNVSSKSVRVSVKLSGDCPGTYSGKLKRTSKRLNTLDW